MKKKTCSDLPLRYGWSNPKNGQNTAESEPLVLWTGIPSEPFRCWSQSRGECPDKCPPIYPFDYQISRLCSAQIPEMNVRKGLVFAEVQKKPSRSPGSSNQTKRTVFPPHDKSQPVLPISEGIANTYRHWKEITEAPLETSNDRIKWNYPFTRLPKQKGDSNEIRNDH
jgi:hypothetical protein